MKSLFLLTCAAALTSAAAIQPLRTNANVSASEFTTGGCKDFIMIFARGSAEIGTLGVIAGPPTAAGLKQQLGADRVAVEGVPYAALLSTNFLPGGADPVGISAMKNLIGRAATQCPNSKLLVGGYSQGAAVTHRAIESLPDAQKQMIAAAFTYGDTQNKQDNGQINNFPPEKTIVICNLGDLVCKGTLVIAPPHLDYTRRAREAVDFIVSRV